jgi:glycerophosphoryl diester phosphodiesterase
MVVPRVPEMTGRFAWQPHSIRKPPSERPHHIATRGVPEVVKQNLRRVGHKGAHAIIQGNTLESFDAALSVGVDMIEFDVLPINPRKPHSDLVLAHDLGDLESPETLVRLEDALAHLSGPQFDGIEFDVDLKIPGYEKRLAEELVSHDLASRSLISSGWERSLERVRATAPEIKLGWSVPHATRDWTANPITFLPAMGMLAWLRSVLPERAAERIRDGLIDGVMAHWLVATPKMRDEVLGAGGELYVWTVDDARRMRGLAELGVSGIITNDPRLFELALSPITA